MSRESAQAKVELSVVIAVRDEAENIRPLLEELRAVLDGQSSPYEVVFVDDGSRDGTEQELARIVKEDPRIQVTRFDSPRGKSAAWFAGFSRASGVNICTIDGDLQNNPKDIVKLLERFKEGYKLVSGNRVSRKESFLVRRLPSIIGNWLLQTFTGSTLHDHGCGLKIFSKSALERLPPKEGIHRLLGLYFERLGLRVSEVPIDDRNRLHGTSKYGFGRILRFPLNVLNLEAFAFREKLDSEKPDGSIHLPLFLLMLSCFAFALRLYRISYESFWYDELLTILYATLPLNEIASGLRDTSVHPPLYFFLCKIAIGLFSLSEWSLRLISAAAGAGSVVLIYRLCMRLFGLRSAYYAAGLLTFAPFHIYYSQEARPYTLLGALLLWSLDCYYLFLRNPNRKNQLRYLIASSLLLYVHTFGVLTIICQNVHYVLFYGRKLTQSVHRNWLLLQGAILFIFVPWITSLLYQTTHAAYAWIPRPGPAEIFAMFFDFSGRSYLLMAGLLFFAGCGVGAKSVSGRFEHAGISAAFWFFAPLLFILVASFFYKSVFQPRYFFQSFLFLLILSAAGLAHALESRRQLASICFSALCALSLPSLLQQYREYNKAPWREVAMELEKSNDAIMLPPAPESLPLGYYLRSQNPIFFEPDENTKAKTEGVPPLPPIAQSTRQRTAKFITGVELLREFAGVQLRIGHIAENIAPACREIGQNEQIENVRLIRFQCPEENG